MVNYDNSNGFGASEYFSVPYINLTVHSNGSRTTTIPGCQAIPAIKEAHIIRKYVLSLLRGTDTHVREVMLSLTFFSFVI